MTCEHDVILPLVWSPCFPNGCCSFPSCSDSRWSPILTLTSICPFLTPSPSTTDTSQAKTAPAFTLLSLFRTGTVVVILSFIHPIPNQSFVISLAKQSGSIKITSTTALAYSLQTWLITQSFTFAPPTYPVHSNIRPIPAPIARSLR